MKRTFGIAAGVAALALTGTVLAVRAGPANPAAYGITAGTSKATNNVAACSKVGGSGGLCDVTMKGNYFAQALPGVNNGTYKVALVINWATYGYNSQLGENCASATGTETFVSGSSTLKATLAFTDMCEEAASPPVVRDYFINSGTITEATGIWSNINKAIDSVGIQGQSYEFTSKVGSYLDTGIFNNTNLS